MDTSCKHFERLPFYFAFSAAVLGVVSIAASQILLGAAVGTLLLRREWIRAPRVWLPACLFFLLTVASLAMSEDPRGGLPQVKKFFVWLMLFAVYSGIRTVKEAKWLALGIVVAGSASAIWGLVQFGWKYWKAASAGQPFYQSYVADRITGFMSHWMTFGGHMMLALLIVAAYLLFGGDRRWTIAAAVVSLGLVLSFVRSIWGASAVGLLYLLWMRKRWAVAVLPILLLATVFLAPEPVGTRIRSMWNPDKKLDSNEHRVQLRRVGVRMIQAHPVFGLGPMMVKRHFLEYLPDDAPKPWPEIWWYDHLHNTYIHYAAERGIPAVLALLWFLGMALWDFLRAARGAEGDRRILLHAAIACVIGIVVGGWWEVNLGDSEVLSTFLAVVGLGYAVVAQPV